jgi:hypothetical protein
MYHEGDSLIMSPMNRYHIIPTASLGIALVVGAASSAHANSNPTVVNCLNNVCIVLQPGAVDSDGDGFTDLDEGLYGSDPNDPNSRPTMPWMFDRLGDGTLPSGWIDPKIDLITIMPNGDALTTSLTDVLAGMGVKVPDRLGALGVTMAPPGINLGNIGGSLNWNIHGEGKATLPYMPDAPDNSLVGMNPPSESNLHSPQGDVRVTNERDNEGVWTSTVFVTDEKGGRLGSSSATGNDPWKTQAEAVAKATVGATPEAAASIAAAVTAQTQAEAKATQDAADARAAQDKAVKEQNAKARVDREAKEKEAKEKAEKEAKEKAEAEKKAKEKKDGGAGDVDPNADVPVDPSMLSPDEVGRLIEEHDGTQNTNTGDTGVFFAVEDYVDPDELIVLKDPDADGSTSGVPSTTGPRPGSGAGPEYDPNHPQPDFGGAAPVRGGGLH